MCCNHWGVLGTELGWAELERAELQLSRRMLKQSSRHKGKHHAHLFWESLGSTWHKTKYSLLQCLISPCTDTQESTEQNSCHFVYGWARKRCRWRLHSKRVSFSEIPERTFQWKMQLGALGWRHAVRRPPCENTWTTAQLHWPVRQEILAAAPYECWHSLSMRSQLWGASSDPRGRAFVIVFSPWLNFSKVRGMRFPGPVQVWWQGRYLGIGRSLEWTWHQRMCTWLDCHGCWKIRDIHQIASRTF